LKSRDFGVFRGIRKNIGIMSNNSENRLAIFVTYGIIPTLQTGMARMQNNENALKQGDSK